MKLNELSVKRPIAVTMAVLIFVLIGIYALSMLPLEAMPDMDLKMVVVMTNYQNVGSNEIENLVTKRVEGAIASVSGLDAMQSQSSEGMSLVMAQFTNTTDIDEAVSSIENNLDMISSFLPEESDDPIVMKLDTSMLQSMMISASYEGYDITQTKKFIEENVESKLKSVNGVASVNITGGKDRVIDVLIDDGKMHEYDISFSNIVSLVASQNTDLPAGSVNKGNKELPVRMMGKFESISDIGLVPLTTSKGQVVYLRDIANIKDTYSESSTISKINSKESITLSISSESDANTVEVVDGVMAELKRLKTQYPKFSYIVTMEQASYIKEAVASVSENAIMGGLLAILILFLFLGNFKNSLVIGVAMPISIVTTFIGMYALKMSLNVVSLGGLALGVGMLVDNAVVMLENIFRRRSLYGEDAKEASIKGAGEMLAPIVASVLTTCIVYVPILFIDNMMAIMFKQLAFAIVFSQIASLLTTILIVPMLSSKIKSINEENKTFSFILKPFEKLMNKAYKLYETSIRKVLRHRKKFMALVMGVFLLSIIVLFNMGMTLMPTSDEGVISISVKLPEGSKLEDTEKTVNFIEKSIKNIEDIEIITSNIGSGGMMSLGATSSNQGSVTVSLKKDRRTDTEETALLIRQKLSGIAGAQIGVEASGSAMSFSSDEVEYQFSSSDDEKLYDYVKKAENILSQIDGVVETETSLSETKPEIKVKLKSAIASRYGINNAYISSSVRNLLNGAVASQYSEKGSEFDIRIKYPETLTDSYEKLKNTLIKTPTGQWVTLSDIADIDISEGYTTLTRVDQKRVVTISGKLYNTDISTVNRKFNKALNENLPLTDGVSQSSSGTFEIMIDAMKSLVIAIVLGIILMYLVMAAQFENLIEPFIILFTIPLAIIGVTLAFLIARTPFSVVGSIGVLMLMGIIVNNAIVLIDFINAQKKENPDADTKECVVNAGLVRMRPILMTSLTSILGFLPMALSSSGGGKMMQPLAISLIGGLFIGTLLTLYVIPTVYTILEDLIKKRKHKKKA